MKAAIAFILLFFATAAFSKPKPATRIYPAPCAQVWDATKAAVQDHYDVLNLNDQNMSGSFTTGSVWTGVRPIAFSLLQTEKGCQVSVTGHFSGLIHNDKGDLFKRIQKSLDATSKVAEK